MNERRIHRIFEISVLLKGAHALIECIGGLVLAFVSTSAIASLVNALTQDELFEDPSPGKTIFDFILQAPPRVRALNVENAPKGSVQLPLL